MGEDRHRFREERALIPLRLSGFLLWQSILLLAFAQIMSESLFLGQTLGILGMISALIGFVNFWNLPAQMDSWEGREPAGFKRFVQRMFEGRGLGIPCSAIFLALWGCAIWWSFSEASTRQCPWLTSVMC